MKSLFINVIILAIVLVVSNYFSEAGGILYDRLFGAGSSFVNLLPLVGLPLIYIFSLTLLYTAFGGVRKYWWIGILLIPAAAFELYFDLEHIYLPILLGIVGWALGYLVLKLRKSSNL